jgi:hypothetical protein
MPTTIDLERNSGLPSEGQHVFKVIRASEEVGASGPYWRYVLQVQDGDEKGREMLLQLSLSPQARWKMDQFLDGMKAARKGSASMEEFVGKSLIGNVVHEPYEGVNRAALSEMLPYEGSAPRPTATKTTPSAQAELPLDVVEEDDDIPF